MNQLIKVKYVQYLASKLMSSNYLRFVAYAKYLEKFCYNTFLFFPVVICLVFVLEKSLNLLTSRINKICLF